MRDVILFNLFLSSNSRPLVAGRDVATNPFGTKKAVPEGEERLAEVGFDTPALVVNIVIAGVVAGDVLERVPRKGIATVVINSLDGAAGKEPHGLSAGHACEHVGNAGAQSVQKEALEGVIVESTVCIRYIETVVTGVEGCVEPLVHVHGSVPEVLPCVDNKDGECELHGGNEHPVDGLGKCELPRSKGWDDVTRSSLLEEVVATTFQGGREDGVCNGLLAGHGVGVETGKCEKVGDGTLGETDSLSPDSDIVVVLAHGGLGLKDCDGKTNSRLDDLLDDDVAEDVPS